MQLLFTFAFMAILLKSVKLQCIAVVCLHICLSIISQCIGGEKVANTDRWLIGL